MRYIVEITSIHNTIAKSRFETLDKAIRFLSCIQVFENRNGFIASINRCE